MWNALSVTVASTAMECSKSDTLSNPQRWTAPPRWWSRSVCLLTVCRCCCAVSHSTWPQLVNNSAYQLSTSPLDPNHPALARLVHWLAPSAQFHSVYIQYDDSGDHCLHALHKIPAGQTVLSVPYSHMLTLDQAKESTIGRQLTQRWDNETSRHAYIAAYVLSEAARGNDGDWWPYLQSLPASTNHLASAWSDDELQWLKGTEALRIAREQQQMVQEAYDQARALPSFTFTFDSYAHARRLIFSRLFSYTAAQGHRSVALVPMIDLLNHATSDRYNTLWTYNTTLQAFTMYTTAPLSAHQPLLTSYGDKSNSELLTSYGFVLETNEWDKAEVGYEGVDGDGEPVTRSAQLTAEYGNSQSQLLMLNMRRYAVQAAIAMLKRRLERVRNETLAGADVQEKQRGLRVQVERLVLHRVADAVRQADDRYGGDRAAEVARLARWTGERGKEWQALVVRVGERRVLQWWLDVCTLGERWLADGVSPAQSWEGERAEVRRLGAQSLVKSVWLVALEDEKAEQARSVPSGVHELR